MEIDDMQQSLELLNNIKNFFYNIEEIEKKLNTDLYNKEGDLCRNRCHNKKYRNIKKKSRK